MSLSTTPVHIVLYTEECFITEGCIHRSDHLRDTEKLSFSFDGTHTTDKRDLRYAGMMVIANVCKTINFLFITALTGYQLLLKMTRDNNKQTKTLTP